MYENILHDGKIKVTGKALTAELLLIDWSDFVYIYSYIVIYRNDQTTIKYMYSDAPEYNTIDIEDAILKILRALASHNGQDGVVCFDQAPIETYILLHEPMIEKMAKQIQSQWSKLELEDLCQICRMCCVELYNKGYYLHKRLIWTTFKNRVTEEIRPLKKRGNVVSIYDKSYDNPDDEKDLTIEDTIVDTDAVYAVQDEMIRLSEKLIFEEVKDIIVDLIGSRQFDTLYRDYKNKHTTTTSRKLLIKIKSHLASLGITREDFNNKYY